MSLLVIIEPLNLGLIFQFFLDSVDVNTRYKKVVVTTTSSLPLAPETSLLVVLLLLFYLFLVGRRLLVLATRYISRRNVYELSLSNILLLLLCGPVSFEIC